MIVNYIRLRNRFLLGALNSVTFAIALAVITLVKDHRLPHIWSYSVIFLFAGLIQLGYARAAHNAELRRLEGMPPRHDKQLAVNVFMLYIIGGLQAVLIVVVFLRVV